MKIALVTDGVYPFVIGGIQKHSFYLAKYFAIHKIEVFLYHTYSNPSQERALNFFSTEELNYIHSIVVPFPSLDKFPGHYVRETNAYSKMVFEKLKPAAVDFIYVQGLCGMYILEHKHELKAPVGVNFHGLEMFQYAADLKSGLAQYLFKKPVLKSLQKADVVFSLGGKLTQLMTERGIPLTKIREIPIGIDASWLNKNTLMDHQPRQFVFIGRYERRKGLKELTMVLAELLNTYDLNFKFIGEIPEQNRIKSGKVQYYGVISDMKEIKNILLETDVIVCPSYSEGMPTVILEAMAVGLAVLASDVGAVSDQVNTENGILINPGNTDELKKAMCSFINMPQDQLLKMKERSISKIQEHFLWEHIIVKTIQAIEGIIGHRN